MYSILVSLLFLFSPPLQAQTPPAAAIASASPLATQAGLDILKAGGNAFDAAVTVTAVLAVVEPFHSGLGGGGFFLLHTAKNKKSILLDARERAPLAAHANMYLDAQGEVIPRLSLDGPLAAAIPGEPAALVYLAKHYGNLPLTKTLAPAIHYAKQGFAVDRVYLAAAKLRFETLKNYPSSAAIFLKQNQIPQLGDTIVQPALARTLELLAAKEAKGFYAGETAEKLVASVKANGGIWSLQDLQQYCVKLRDPLIGHYADFTIITTPPPSAGGIALITMLNILSAYDLRHLPEVTRIHLIVEAMRRAYWDRARYLGDADFVKVPITHLISHEHARELRSNINLRRATVNEALAHHEYSFRQNTLYPPSFLRKQESRKLVAPNVFNARLNITSKKSTCSMPLALDSCFRRNDGENNINVPHDDGGANTTHFSILDHAGNRVAATLSINYMFGSGFTAAGTGVLLNNEMDDFATKPGATNLYGLVGSIANAIAPGKRPLSSMSPTFLVNSHRIGILGTPGGSRIPTMILLATLDFAAGKPPSSWVALLRFHHQFLPNLIQHEPNAFDTPTQQALQQLGHQLKPISRYFGDMQAILWDKQEQQVSAASDPRRVGQAMTQK